MYDDYSDTCGLSLYVAKRSCVWSIEVVFPVLDNDVKSLLHYWKWPKATDTIEFLLFFTVVEGREENSRYENTRVVQMRKHGISAVDVRGDRRSRLFSRDAFSVLVIAFHVAYCIFGSRKQDIVPNSPPVL